jgi:hypothetical protein
MIHHPDNATHTPRSQIIPSADLAVTFANYSGYQICPARFSEKG